jgi:hypothetical protein
MHNVVVLVKHSEGYPPFGPERKEVRDGPAIARKRLSSSPGDREAGRSRSRKENVGQP